MDLEAVSESTSKNGTTRNTVACDSNTETVVDPRYNKHGDGVVERFDG